MTTNRLLTNQVATHLPLRGGFCADEKSIPRECQTNLYLIRRLKDLGQVGDIAGFARENSHSPWLKGADDKVT